jgi:WD40 repeat protein
LERTLLHPQAEQRQSQIDANEDGMSVLAVQPDGELLATNWYGGDIDIWNLRTGQWQAAWKAGKERVVSLAFHPNGKQLAAGDVAGNLFLMNSAEGKMQHTMRGPQQLRTTAGLAYSPNGRWLAQSGLAQGIAIWDTQTGRRVTTCLGHGLAPSGMPSVTSVAFANVNGQLVLASCASDTTLRLWDASDPAFTPLAVASLRTLATYKAYDARLGAAIDDATRNILKPGAPPEVLEQLPLEDATANELLAVAFTQGGQRLLVGGWNGPLREYDVPRLLAEAQRPPDKIRAETIEQMSLHRQGMQLAPLRRNHLVKVASGENHE